MRGFCLRSAGRLYLAGLHWVVLRAVLTTELALHVASFSGTPRPFVSGGGPAPRGDDCGRVVGCGSGV